MFSAGPVRALRALVRLWPAERSALVAACAMISRMRHRGLTVDAFKATGRRMKPPHVPTPEQIRPTHDAKPLGFERHVE